MFKYTLRDNAKMRRFCYMHNLQFQLHILEDAEIFRKDLEELFVEEDMQILCNQYIMMLLIKTKTISHVTLYTRYFQDMM